MSAQPAESPRGDGAAVSRRPAGDGVCVVSVAGTLGVAALPALRDELLQAVDDGCVDVVLELGGAEAVDEAALALLELVRRHRLPGDAIAVCADRRLGGRLARAGLPVEATVDAALWSLSHREARR